MDSSLESTPDKEGTISSSIRGNFQLKKFQNEKDLKKLDVEKMRILLEGAPSKSIYSLLGATFSREMKKGTPSKSMYSLLGVPFSKITIHIRFIETY